LVVAVIVVPASSASKPAPPLRAEPSLPRWKSRTRLAGYRLRPKADRTVTKSLMSEGLLEGVELGESPRRSLDVLDTMRPQPRLPLLLG
jgi:hypothetical protein